MSSAETLKSTLKNELISFREGGDVEAFRAFMDAHHAPEIAEALEVLGSSDQSLLFENVSAELQADLLEETDGRTQEFLLGMIEDPGRRSAVLEEMGADDVADIIDEMSEEAREEVLAGIDVARAEKIRGLARYQPDTAGGIMTTDLLAVEEAATVQSVKDRIRGDDDIESIDNSYVVANGRLVGVFSARDLLLAGNDDLVSSFMTTNVISIEVEADVEECFRIMETHHLSTLPVVGGRDDLLGIITVDDVLTVGEEEGSEDVFLLAGSADIHPTRDSVIGRVSKRIPYLLVSVAGGFGGAAVMKLMGEHGIEKAFFLPMVAMLGGNIAQQSSAVMVRGFATGEVESSRIPRIVLDELKVGVCVGVLCATLGGMLAYILGGQHPTSMGTAVALSICFVSGVSSILGTTIPSIFHRFDRDPAIAAGPFITMLIDMIAIGIYLSIVNALLGA